MNHPDVIRRGDLKYNDNRYLRTSYDETVTATTPIVFTSTITVTTLSVTGLTSGYLTRYNGSKLVDSIVSEASGVITIGGSEKLTTCTNYGAAADKILIWGSDNVFYYRTAAEILSDIGASPAAHNFLAATHADTTAASCVRGDIITGQGATPKWTRLAIGTNGYFLKSNGTDAAWAAHGLTYTDVSAAPAAHGVTVNYLPYANAATTWATTTIQYASATGNYAIGASPLSYSRLYSYVTNTNATYYGIFSQIIPPVTANGTYNNYALVFDFVTSISNGIVNSGSYGAVYGQILHQSLGQIANLSGLYVSYGTYTTNAGNIGTRCCGLRMVPYYGGSGNTIANFYDIFIDAPTYTGATVTNKYSIYSRHDAANYLLGGIQIASDTNGIVFGAGLDTKIYYNGTDLLYNSTVVGTGVHSFTGTMRLNTCVDAGSDVDKFLVLDGSGNVDYRTGAETLSDIGAAPALSLTTSYIPKAASATTLSDSIIYETGGKIGMGITSPDTMLHIYASSAGVVTANVNCVLTIEKNDNTGMSILCPNNKTSSIYFGDNDDNGVGRIIYNHSTDTMSFVTSSSIMVYIDSTGVLTLNTTNDAGVDTGKFLVLDAGKNVDYRTGAEILADLSGDAGATFSWNNQTLSNIGTVECTNAAISSLSAGYLPYNKIAADLLADSIIYQSSDTPASAKIGIYTTSPDSLLHVYAASAGTVTATTDTVLTLEKNDSLALSFLSPNNKNASIYFGDPDDNDVGRIIYNHTDNSLSFYTATHVWMMIDSSGHLFAYTVRAGATQAAAGAAAGEIWQTLGHATLPDHVLMYGV